MALDLELVHESVREWLQKLLDCKHSRKEPCTFHNRDGSPSDGVRCLDCGAARTNDAREGHWCKPQGVTNVEVALQDMITAPADCGWPVTEDPDDGSLVDDGGRVHIHRGNHCIAIGPEDGSLPEVGPRPVD